MTIYRVEADVEFANGVGVQRCVLQLTTNSDIATEAGMKAACDTIHRHLYYIDDSLFPGDVKIIKTESTTAVVQTNDPVVWLNPDVVVA